MSAVSSFGDITRRLYKASEKTDSKQRWKITVSLLFIECQIALEIGKSLEEWFLSVPRWARVAAVAIHQEEGNLERWDEILNRRKKQNRPTL